MSGEPLTPIYTAALFPPLHAELLALLRGLGPAEWERPTVAWRLLYNAIPIPEARRRARVEGDESWAEPLFSTRSVMV